MRPLRTLVSALSIVVGVVFIAVWALANVVVNVVEDGTAARAITERALDSPTLMGAVSHDLSERTQAALSDVGLNVDALGLESQLDQVITRAVGSQAFRGALLDQVDNAHNQFSEQLTDNSRPPAPLAISVDLSDSINNRIGELGAPAALVPDLKVPPVNIQVLETQRFEQAREAYGKVLWVQTWGLWCGIAALAAGFVVSHRKRWFIAKVLVGCAAVCLAFAGVVALLGPGWLAGVFPGGDDGVWASLWRDIVGEDGASVVVERSLVVGGVALVGGLIALAIGVAAGERQRQRR